MLTWSFENRLLHCSTSWYKFNFSIIAPTPLKYKKVKALHINDKSILQFSLKTPFALLNFLIVSNFPQFFHWAIVKYFFQSFFYLFIWHKSILVTYSCVVYFVRLHRFNCRNTKIITTIKCRQMLEDWLTHIHTYTVAFSTKFGTR